jgi:hypothetical protein
MSDETGYLEIIDARTDAALITGEGADFGSYAENQKKFEEAKRQLAVSHGRFLVDLHDTNGDLVDTFRINGRGFAQLTGKKPKSIAEYKRIDTKFWEEARAHDQTPSA